MFVCVCVRARARARLQERGGGVTYIVLLSKLFSLSKDGKFALSEALRGLPHHSEESP